MCWENTSGIWQSDRLTPTYAKPYANSPAICVEICRAVKMERRRNGVNKGFANDYERLYKAGISNSENLGFYTNTPILHQSVLKSVQQQKNRIIFSFTPPLRRYSFSGASVFSHSFYSPRRKLYRRWRNSEIRRLRQRRTMV